MRDDWFRNTTWNAETEARFEQKLRRARRKEQYLRIQASMLASTHPLVALALLDRYFSLPDKFDNAQGHVDRANALLALGRIDLAADSLLDALRREEEFPRLRTQAYLEFPVLVATTPLPDRFAAALEILDTHSARPMFPVDRFLWNAARALILAARGSRSDAKLHAAAAEQAAAESHSGFRHHPSIGLVSERHDLIRKRLAAIAAA